MFGALRLPLEGVVERFAHVSIYLWLVTGLPSSERNFDALLTLSCPMFRRPEPLWVYLSEVPKLLVMGIFWTELSAAAGTAASRSYADLMCIRMVVIIDRLGLLGELSDMPKCVRSLYFTSRASFMETAVGRTLRRQLIATGGCKNWQGGC